MKIKSIMSPHVTACSRSTPVRHVATLMAKYGLGAVPVVDGEGEQRRAVGIVTDRDIVCRVVAAGLDCIDTTAESCMSSPVFCLHPDDDVEECIQQMGKRRIRRVLVSDESGTLRGIVTQSDVAHSMPPPQIGQVVKRISSDDSDVWIGSAESDFDHLPRSAGQASLEDQLDNALDDTFPASDPPSVGR